MVGVLGLGGFWLGVLVRMVLGELLRSFGLVGIWVRMVMRFMGMMGLGFMGMMGLGFMVMMGMRVYGYDGYEGFVGKNGYRGYGGTVMGERERDPI